MDLRIEKAKIAELIQRNRVGIIKNEQELEGLKNGSVFLQGQMALIEKLIATQDVEEKAKNENISANLPTSALPPAPTASVRPEPSSAPAPSDNSPSGNGS